MTNSLGYYDQHASDFFADTVFVDMEILHQQFLSHIPAGGLTISKQGKASDQRYVNHWIDGRTFHWQSQNQTGPVDKRSRSLIEHEK